MTQSTAIATQGEADLLRVLEASLYPGASQDSIKMALGYCKAAGLDPLQKPVHIVPMWDGKRQQMRDVIMPGVNLYRTQAARTGNCAGISEPEFGPDTTATIGGVEITFPLWCKVAVRRRLPSGEIVEFTAKEFWRENYAVKGGKEKSIAPNAMWLKRPYGQIAKCAESQALRKAFPELAGPPTAEEMEGKSLLPDAETGEIAPPRPARPALPAAAPVQPAAVPPAFDPAQAAEHEEQYLAMIAEATTQADIERHVATAKADWAPFGEPALPYYQRVRAAASARWRVLKANLATAAAMTHGTAEKPATGPGAAAQAIQDAAQAVGVPVAKMDPVPRTAQQLDDWAAEVAAEGSAA